MWAVVVWGLAVAAAGLAGSLWLAAGLFALAGAADSVSAGGPPTQTLTRNGSPLRIAAAWWTPMPRWIW